MTFFGYPRPPRTGATCSCGPDLPSCFPFFCDESLVHSFFINSSTGCPLLLFCNLFDFLPASKYPALGVFPDLPPDCTLFCALLDLGPRRAQSPELANIQGFWGYLLLPGPGHYSLMVSPVSSLCSSCCLPTPSHTIFLPPPGKEPSSLSMSGSVLLPATLTSQ